MRFQNEETPIFKIIWRSVVLATLIIHAVEKEKLLP